MKFKKLVVLIIILVVLAALGVAKKMQVEKAERAGQKAAVATQAFLPGFDSAAVQKLSYQAGDDEKTAVRLVKKESGDWVVESYFNARAKKWNVDQLLKNLSEAKGEVRSDSSQVLDDYLLSDNQAVHLKCLGASEYELGHILISPTRAPAWQNFARLSGSDQVWVISQDILAALNIHNKDAKPDPKTFADLQTVKLDASGVTKIEMAAKKGFLTLVKSEDKEKKTSRWNFEPAAKEEMDANKASGLLSSLANIYGKQVLDPKQTSYGFDEKSPWIRVSHTKDDKPAHVELYLGRLDAEKKTYPLKVMPDGIVYETNEASIDAVKTERANFVKK